MDKHYAGQYMHNDSPKAESDGQPEEAAQKEKEGSDHLEKA